MQCDSIPKTRERKVKNRGRTKREVEYKCCSCKKKFWRAPDSRRSQNRTFCSRACYSQHNLKKCKICDKTFRPKHARGQIYCSMKCRDVGNSGEGNPMYVDGMSAYRRALRCTKPIREWRRKVLERDHYKCVRCGEIDYLHAHHIIPFAQSKKLRTAVSNGMTLCDFCHSDVHKRWVGHSEDRRLQWLANREELENVSHFRECAYG